jgi:tetratricopeptide (TPR) repeat protein
VDGDATTIGFNSGDSAPDTVIGPYRLLKQIGEGGMGVVYHAQQLQPIRREVALKVIKPGMDSRQVVTRFETERQALAVMDHPNIAHVFDAGATENGRPYFVMELVDGIPITHYCDSKRLTVRERVELFIPVCQAIQHAHQKGVIHRDIKPSNILVAEQAGRPVPKVIDFGLAKALGHQLSEASMMTNAAGMIVGTPDYMSPEQAELTRQDMDTRSDVYSLGAVLYELLIGTTPLKHEDSANAAFVDVLQRIRQEEPKPPSQRVRHSVALAETAKLRRSDEAALPKLVVGELDWITMKALEKDRTRRYETVSGMVRDLQRYLAGDAVEAGPPSASYRLGKLVRKHRAGLATAAAFAALLVAGIIVSTWLAVRATRAEQEALAINDFLQNDLLAQASANNQARPDNKPDPDLKVRTALDRAAEGIKEKFSAQPLVEASIRQTIATTYIDLGLYPEAQEQLDRALELLRRVLGENHPDTLNVMGHVGDAYTYRGKYAEAQSLLNRALDIGQRALGEEHPTTMFIMNNLGFAYERDGKFFQAEPLYVRVLELRRRVFGRDHPATLVTTTNLAAIYYRQARYAEAEPIFSEVLEVRRRVLGDEHPHTSISLNNLAMTYRAEGKYLDAEPLFIRALEVRRRTLGERHPDTLRSMNNLGMLYADTGRYEQAEKLYTESLESRRRELGEEHPDTLATWNNLASLYARQRKFPEAEALFIKVFNARRRTLGDSNPDTAATANELAKLYDDWGKPQKAAEQRQAIQSADGVGKQN